MTALPKQPNQSVIDGIRCLQEVVVRTEPVGVSDIAEELHMEMTRVHRLLRTLAHMGLLSWTEKRKYAPGPALPILAAQTLHATGFHKAIVPLEALHQELNMVTALGVFWNRSVSYLYHADPDQPPEQAIGSFGIWPATTSGLGIALLALQPDAAVKELYAGEAIPDFASIDLLLEKLAEVRRCGYALHRHTLALVIGGTWQAAVGISSDKVTQSTVKRHLPHLKRCVDRIVGQISRQ